MMAADCDWSEANIGTHRYTGTAATAIHHYVDIPPPVQARLIARMDRHYHDGIIEITNETPLTGMHYVEGRMCKTVTRNWRAGFTVPALRYTEDGFTVLVPVVCGNVVRSTYIPPARPQPAAVVEAESIDLGPASGAPISGPVTFAQASSNAAELVSFEPFPLPPYIVAIGMQAGPCCLIVRTPPVPAVPEPKSWVLLAMGAIALRLRRLARC